LATFARRREIGIMRLVGASNFYITMPFLLGAVISALIGVTLACLTMAAGVYFWIVRGVRNSVRFIAWIGWQQLALAMLGVIIVGVVLAVIPTLVTTRRYLRV
jgi:cell division transport system permease protein